jgi:hypothetical protein
MLASESVREIELHQNLADPQYRGHEPDGETVDAD